MIFLPRFPYYWSFKTPQKRRAHFLGQLARVITKKELSHIEAAKILRYK